MKTRITILCILLLLMAGCLQGEVQMSPRMQSLTKWSAINVRAMSKDCQAGNENSCRAGLEAAAETLEEIVNAM